MQDSPYNLLGFDRKALQDLFASWGEKSFRADQVLKWIHAFQVTDFNEMTNLSKSLRAQLQEKCIVEPLTVLSEHASRDGTRKWLFHMEGASAIETVYIPETERATLCISSQVGCVLNCGFCHTAKQGFQRNLTAAEIIGQVWHVVNQLKKEGVFIVPERTITNVVLMGMGEPLLNFDNVVMAMNLMLDDLAYGLSKRRVTLSTSGVVPMIDKLAQVTDVALAVSLHAPNDELRSQIVPLNKKYPIAELLAACKRYLGEDKRKKITMEYVMLAGVNDKPEHAKELIRILNDVPSKVNLIPFNPFKGADFTCSDENTIARFQEILMKAGIITLKRKTRGQDIDAACGQLAGKVKDKTQRSQKFQQRFTIPITTLTPPPVSA